MNTKHTPGPFISRKQVLKLNEKHGWFQYRDSQSDVSNAFANDAIKAYERIRSAAPDLLEALQGLLSDIESLMDESGGVYGLHLNGDPSPWNELDEGGRFERLSNLSEARAAIAKATGEPQ